MDSNNYYKYILTLLGIIAFVLVFAYFYTKSNPPEAKNFTECTALSGFVTESFPRQCRTPNGKTFTEGVGDVVVKANLVKITTPKSNAIIKSPLFVAGEAKGAWFFEAQFPVKIVDSNGNLLGSGPAHAKGDWMTTDFVPFEVNIDFKNSETATGTVILEKDNPSGLPQNADSFKIPVRFK